MLGVEIVEEAIEDAKFNAENNGIDNCKFYAGNCDDYINSLVHQATSKDILAIIDPPRAGLREYIHITLMSIRSFSSILF